MYYQKRILKLKKILIWYEHIHISYRVLQYMQGKHTQLPPLPLPSSTPVLELSISFPNMNSIALCLLLKFPLSTDWTIGIHRLSHCLKMYRSSWIPWLLYWSSFYSEAPSYGNMWGMSSHFVLCYKGFTESHRFSSLTQHCMTWLESWEFWSAWLAAIK